MEFTTQQRQEVVSLLLNSQKVSDAMQYLANTQNQTIGYQTDKMVMAAGFGLENGEYDNEYIANATIEVIKIEVAGQANNISL